jgi:hypothetical protein
MHDIPSNVPDIFYLAPDIFGMLDKPQKMHDNFREMLDKL